MAVHLLLRPYQAKGWGGGGMGGIPVSVFPTFSFDLGVTAPQDLFINFETSQSLGGAKTGDPRDKPSDYPQAELGLSHI